MSVENRLAILALVIALAALAGYLWKRNAGKTRAVSEGIKVDLRELQATKDGSPVTKFGEKMTFLQFSGQYCSQCPPTARVLGQLAARTPGAIHIEVDITNRLDLAKKFNVMQTPTTFVLDKNGKVTSRIAGAPNTTTLESELGTFEI